MRTLITGAGGFVGKHLGDELLANGYEATTTDIRGEVDFLLDLMDPGAVREHFSRHQYDSIVHLAGFSSVGRSWQAPKRTLELNTFPTLHIMDALAAGSPQTRLLIIGSSEQYGVVRSDKVYIDETEPMHPANPYAISKWTQERMAWAVAVSKKLDVVFTRSFNHIGTGQEKGFVIADFASAVAAVMQGGEPVLYVGNTEAFRDFTDVRDVVRAYRLLLEKGKSGEAYNVGSGRVYSIQELLDMLIALSGQAIEVRKDPAKMRPVEVMKLGCCYDKLKEATDWVPQTSMIQSLEDVLCWWQT